MKRLIEGKEIKDKYINDALNLDRITYPDDYWLSLETCVDYFKKNPDIYSMILDDEKDEVVAYINFSPISKEMYENFIQGNLIDTVITDNDVVVPDKNKDNYLYLSSIIVREDERHHGYAKMLLNSVATKMENYLKEGVHFIGIVCDAVSGHGKKLCDKLGLKLVVSSNHESKIYSRDLKGDNLNDFIKKLKGGN